MISKITTVALAGATALFIASAPAQAQWHHHWHHWHGGGFGAGIAGFAAGALIGGALASGPNYYYGPPGPAYVYEPAYSYGPAYAAVPEQSYAPSVAWCEQHYRSYDPASETYLGYDGVRHHCP